MEINFDNVEFRKDPYPIGVAHQVFGENDYQELVETFPPLSLLPRWDPGKYNKYALNEAHPDFHAHIRKYPLWSAFYTSIKHPTFPLFLISLLKAYGVKVALVEQWFTRFEFAAMPADGGYIRPHTDTPQKVITLVFSMLKPGDWNPAFGGGTDVLKPLDPSQTFKDYEAPLDAFEKVYTYEYVPNQCVIFHKTENSWHSVSPMTGVGSSMLRRTITLNIETVDTLGKMPKKPRHR